MTQLTKALSCLLLVAAHAFGVCTPATGYTYCKPVTIDAAGSTLTDFTSYFPGNVNGETNFKSTGNGGLLTSSSGFDLIFTSAEAGTGVLPCFLVPGTYSASAGTGGWYIKQTLTTSTTVIYASFSNSGISSSQCTSTSTWKSTYKGIWAMQSTAPADDTTNPNDGSAVGSPSAVAGKVNGAVNISRSSGVDNYINAGVADSSLNNTTNTVTVSAWIKRNNASMEAAFNVIFSKGAGGSGSGYAFSFHGTATTSSFRMEKGGIANFDIGAMSADQNWHHVVLVASGSGIVVYVDGSASAGTDANATAIVTNAGNATLGFAAQGSTNNTFYLDEVKVCTDAYTADWVAAEYSNTNDPANFLALGTTVPTPPTLPVGGRTVMFGSW